MPSEHGFTRMIQSLRVTLWRRRVVINIVLSVTAAALAAALSIRHWLSTAATIAPEDRLLDQASRIASILTDITTTGALLLGGLWSYYIFVKGRTFKPRLNIGLMLKSVTRSVQGVAVVTCRITNSGKVRIRPKYASVDVDLGDTDAEGLSFKAHHHIDDLFSLFYAEDEAFWLEPQDQLTIDFAVIGIPGSSRSVGQLMHVKIQIVDCEYNLWRQSAILALADLR